MNSGFIKISSQGSEFTYRLILLNPNKPRVTLMVKHKTTLPRTRILLDAEKALLDVVGTLPKELERKDRYRIGSLLGTPAQQVHKSGPPRSVHECRLTTTDTSPVSGTRPLNSRYLSKTSTPLHRQTKCARLTNTPHKPLLYTKSECARLTPQLTHNT